MTVSKSPRPRVPWSQTSVPNWTESDTTRDPDLRSMDDQVEMRCKAKRLCDCELPDGFNLVTRFPKQYPLDQQLRWAFELSYTPHHMLVTTYRHVARYHQEVSDETQMHWAVEDFTAELIAAGVFRSEKQRRESPQERAEIALS